MIKLIASDLDGTLLLNHAQSLNPGTAKLIHELTKQGRIFAAASGRQYPNLYRLFHGVEDEIAYLWLCIRVRLSINISLTGSSVRRS